MILIGLSLLLFVGIAAILLFLVYILYPKKSLVQERIESLKPHVEETILWDAEPNKWQKILGRLGKNVPMRPQDYGTYQKMLVAAGIKKERLPIFLGSKVLILIFLPILYLLLYGIPVEKDSTMRIISAIALAIRFGYRRIHDLLRPEFPDVNHKRVYRLYSAAKLAVKKRRKAKRPTNERMPLQIAQAVNDVWSMDFVCDSLVNGRRIKCLTVADDLSHECIDIGVDFGISRQYVTRLLYQAATFRGYPRVLRTDNGPEFTSRAFMAWAQARGIRHLLIEPGRPTQNGHIESFNGKFRDECLNEHWFETLTQARRLLPFGDRTTTKSDPTVAVGECRQPGLPHSIGSKNQEFG